MWEPGPFISPGSLQLLLRARPTLVGVDFRNRVEIAMWAYETGRVKK